VDARIARVLEHGLCDGPEVSELERALADTAAPGTASRSRAHGRALIALMSSDRPGDEVITAPFTFIARPRPSPCWRDAVFVDVDRAPTTSTACSKRRSRRARSGDSRVALWAVRGLRRHQCRRCTARLGVIETRRRASARATRAASPARCRSSAHVFFPSKPLGATATARTLHGRRRARDADGETDCTARTGVTTMRDSGSRRASTRCRPRAAAKLEVFDDEVDAGSARAAIRRCWQSVCR